MVRPCHRFSMELEAELLSIARHVEVDDVSLSTLPAELLFELAIRSPIRALRRVVRFDARLVACVRLQRWFRHWEARGHTCLSVGDRVLVRGGSNVHKLQYATAAAHVHGGVQWKVRLLNDEYVNVPVHRIRRLEEWANGPWTGSVGLSAALASASRACGAATQATTAAVVAMRAGVSPPQTALAIAAATAASTAAAAAAAASSAVAPAATRELQHAHGGGQLLFAAQQMQEAILDTQRGVMTLAPTPEDVATTVLAQAASAAAEAAAEAEAAASAAVAAATASNAAAVDAVGALASTAAATVSATDQVVTAVTAMASGTSSSTTILAAEAAAHAFADVGVAGLSLSSASTSSGGGTLTSSACAVDAAQAAAKVLLEVVTPSRIMSVAEQSASSCPEIKAASDDDPLHVAMPSWEDVAAFLRRANPSAYGSPVIGAARSPNTSTAQVSALDDAARGIFQMMSSSAAKSSSGLLRAGDCPIMYTDNDPRNVWVHEGRFHASTRTVSLPYAGLTATIQQRWNEHEAGGRRRERGDELTEIEGQCVARVRTHHTLLPPTLLMSMRTRANLVS